MCKLTPKCEYKVQPTGEEALI